MLIGELASGGVDVVGDVHGEYAILVALLKRLGYDANGRHADDRCLVFVGDLTDRGPDSPAVVRLVTRLIDNGRAQCVVGNHELNIMRGERKDGNAWFFGERDHRRDGGVTDEVIADQRIRDEVMELFARLPIALERSDLRVVHACWHDGHADSLRDVSGDVVAFSQQQVDRLDAEHAPLAAAAQMFEAKHRLDIQENPPPFDANYVEFAVRQQNDHAVKVMTSGLEAAASEPFWAGGRWRFENRVPWWTDYEGAMVVIGHYWRSLDSTRPMTSGHDLFAGTHATAPLGRGHVMCVDYAIGRRAIERAQGRTPQTALAAYRWPEAELVLAR